MKKQTLKELITEVIIPKKEKALILFYSTQCEHCSDMREHLTKLVEGKKIHYIELVDIDENQDMKNLFDIMFFPTLVEITNTGYKHHVGATKIKQITI